MMKIWTKVHLFVPTHWQFCLAAGYPRTNWARVCHPRNMPEARFQLTHRWKLHISNKFPFNQHCIKFPTIIWPGTRTKIWNSLLPSTSLRTAGTYLQLINRCTLFPNGQQVDLEFGRYDDTEMAGISVESVSTIHWDPWCIALSISLPAYVVVSEDSLACLIYADMIWYML